MARKTLQWVFSLVMLCSLVFGLVMPAGTAAARSETPAAQAITTRPTGLQAYSPQPSKVEKGLTEALTQGPANFWVEMAFKADLSKAYSMTDWSARGQFVYNILKQTAETTQKPVIDFLAKKGLKYQSYFADNEIYVYGGNLETANQLAARADISQLLSSRTYYIDEPVLKQVGPQQAPTATMDWGIVDTKANQFWSTYGVKGDGIVVSSIDTGVQWNHPALVDQFKCGSDPTNPACWEDPSGTCGSGGACDNVGHGTHTMGTMVGKDSSSLQYIVGMAPNAQWIACKGCTTNSCSDTDLNACADWLLAPAGDPNNRPNVVNNSWGGTPGGDPWYQGKVQAWSAAGIFPAFSAGNSGPTCNSMGDPGDYQEAFASAAHDNSRTIASFSSRGPSAFGDTPYTKPNISAPGVNICSSVPGNGWDCSYGGTSMASPHTAGAVALLWSCNPSLKGNIDATFQALQSSADAAPAGNCGAPAGGQGNHTYGYGYLNVLAAGAAICGGTGTFTGTVTTGGSPLAGVTVTAVNEAPPGYSFSAVTNASGVYTINAGAGTYDLTAAKYGYTSQSANGLVLAEGAVVSQDFSLAQLPTTAVKGEVTDDSGHAYPLYARIDISSTGFSTTVYTAPFTGAYSVDLLIGASYDFAVTAVSPGYNTATATGVVFPGATGTQDFGLTVSDSCIAAGYQLMGGVAQNFDSVTPPSLPAGWVSQNGNTATWQTNAGTHFPSGVSAHSDPNLVYFNSYSASTGDTARLVYQGSINMTTVADAHLSFWMYHDTGYSSNADSIQYQVSTDDGATWTNVGPVFLRYDGTTQWTQHTVDLSAYASETDLMITILGYSGFGNDVHVDDISIGTPVCTMVSGGLVGGFTTDLNTTNPLVAVKVVSDTGASAISMATPDDTNIPDGVYMLFQPVSDVETHTYTATGASGYGVVSAGVEITPDAVSQHNFSLPAGLLSADPTSLDATVDLFGSATTQTMTLSNTGSLSASYELKNIPGGYTPQVHIPAYTGAPVKRVVSIRRDPNAPSVPAGKTAGALGILTGSQAFAADLGSSSLVSFTADTPSPWTVVGSYGSYSFFGGAFLNGDFSKEYMLDYVGNNLYTVTTDNPVTTTLVGSSVPGAGESWTGLTSGPDGTLYGVATTCSSSSLYTVDPVTGTATLVGPISNGGCIIDIAMDLAGDMFGVDIASANLIAINPATGAGTLVGALGYSPNYAQGLAFDHDTNTLYWAAYSQSDGQLRVIDTTTGASTLVGAFPGGSEVDAMAFANGGNIGVSWLSEDPTTGVVATGDNQPVTVTFDPSSLTQPGTFTAKIHVAADTPYKVTDIPVTLHVIMPQDWGKVTGTVAGLGLCDATPAAPLKGATVTISQGSSIIATLTTDAAGSYTYSALNGTYTVAVALPNYVGSSIDVAIPTARGSVTQDFTLRRDAPCIIATPDSLTATVDINGHTTIGMTLNNTGAGAGDFSIKEKSITAASGAKSAVHISAFTGNVVHTLASISRAPAVHQLNGAAAAQAIQALTGVPAYAVDTYPGFTYGSFSTDTPGTWSTVGPVDQSSTYFGGTFLNGDFSKEYLLDAGNMLYTISTTDASVVSIGPSAPGSGESWTGLTASVDGTLYASATTCSSSTLYSIDPATGTATPVGAITNGTCIIDIAINADGEMYGVDIVNDNLVSIDPATGAGTVVGSGLSINANYAQGLAFDQDSGILYWAAYNGGTSQGELRLIDTTTGASSLVGAFPGGDEVDALSIATAVNTDVPWLSEDPTSGSIPAGGSATVTVSFDATGLAIGDYNAQLLVTNAPNPKLVLPVSLHVIMPLDWGSVKGTVTSLGLCDAVPAAPVEGATVVISQDGISLATLVTDVNGSYSYPALHGSYTVEVAKDKYIGMFADVAIPTNRGTVTQDFELRRDAACIKADLDSLKVSVDFNGKKTIELKLTNDGLGTGVFSIANSATESVPWMTAKPTSGTIPAGGFAIIAVTFDAKGMASGHYAAHLHITNTPNPQISLPVSFDVNYILFLPVIKRP